MKHLENTSHCQKHGLEKRRPCESQVILAIEDLASDIDAGKKIDAIPFDFSKPVTNVSRHHWTNQEIDSKVPSIGGHNMSFIGRNKYQL